MQTQMAGLLIFAIIAGISIIVFILLREVMCWYFKINLLIEIQNNMIIVLKGTYESNKNIEELLNQIVKQKTLDGKNDKKENIKLSIENENSKNFGLEDENKVKKILYEIGYNLENLNGKWKIEKRDGSGLTYYAYSREELFEKTKNIVNAFKKK